MSAEPITLSIPVRLNSTINDHLKIIELGAFPASLSSYRTITDLAVAVRALQLGLAHELLLYTDNTKKTATIAADDAGFHLYLNDRYISELSGEHLSRLEQWAVARSIHSGEAKSPKCNVYFTGRDGQQIDLTWYVIPE